MLKGYRTIIANMAMSFVTQGTIQAVGLPPEAQKILTLINMAWVFLAILLRLVTSTPVGKKLEADVARELGLTSVEMNAFVSQLPQKADYATLVAQGEKLLTAVEALKAAPAPSPPNGAASG